MSRLTAGLRLDLSALPSRSRRTLVRLLARTSEASYRRGLAHGVAMHAAGEIDEERTAVLRRASLDVAPRAERYARERGVSSVERLRREYGDLGEIGLADIPHDTARRSVSQRPTPAKAEERAGTTRAPNRNARASEP